MKKTISSLFIDKDSHGIDNYIYQDYPIVIEHSDNLKLGPFFQNHWHEQFEILYSLQGEASIYCNSQHIRAKPEEAIIINPNEFHYGDNFTPDFCYYLIKIDLPFFLNSRSDLFETNFMVPFMQNLIVFQNHISGECELLTQIRFALQEYQSKKIGYKLTIKASIYHVLALLLRHYSKHIIDYSEQERKHKTKHLLQPILQYIDEHYTEQLTLNQLATIGNINPIHLCRIFKKLVGKPPLAYINHLRISKALSLLEDSSINITEIAMAVGFTDSNYFSRIFKKHRKISPSEFRASRNIVN